MGNTTILDIIGSVITFAVLLLITLRLNASAFEYSSAFTANSLLQKNMIKLTVRLEEDLKRVGNNTNFAINADTIPIAIADSNRFSFRGDVNNDGVWDLVEYRVGPTSDLASTPNPRDRILFRTENGVTIPMNIGVTEFNFHYYDILNPNQRLDFPITSMGNIGPIEVAIRLESSFRMEQEYMDDTTQYEMLWRQIRTISRNQLLSTSAR
jgi:hypothetical protein